MSKKNNPKTLNELDKNGCITVPLLFGSLLIGIAIIEFLSQR